MALEEPKEDTKIYTVNEIDMIIPEDVFPYTEGNILDFRKDEYGEGFALGPADGGGCSC